ncbi:MAG: CinA family protein [Pseudomonadota bacterium]
MTATIIDDSDLQRLAAELGAILEARGELMATAESCTGGWIAKVMTDVTGSSAWFQGGLVTYANAAKESLLGVDPALLREHGAVSQPVVEAMAAGARERCGVDRACAVSGIAGPGGGTPEKPVGLVWLAWAGPEGVVSLAERFSGDRESIRRQSVARALIGLKETIEMA